MRAILILVLSLSQVNGSIPQQRTISKIQTMLDQTAKVKQKILLIPAGIYQSNHEHRALLHFSKRHNGIKVIGQGKVIFQGSNKQNHVVLFTDGIEPKTILENITIQGSNLGMNSLGPIGSKFVNYSDGGGIKILGASSPTLIKLTIKNNYALLCGGGVSIEQNGESKFPVKIINSKIINNRATLTGAAIDLLPGSHAILENSNVIGNRGNLQFKGFTKTQKNRWPRLNHINLRKGFENSSAITIFRGSSLTLKNSTVMFNRNGVDINHHSSWYTSQKLPSGRLIIETSIIAHNNLTTPDSYDLNNPKSPIRD